MDLSDIAALPVSGVVADDAACFLWVTGPFLAVGAHIPILRAWGFQPSAMAFEWAKTTKAGAFCFGSGHTTRKCVEYVVLGKRGRSVREHADVSELIVAMRREPSRKPDEFFARVERYSRGPYRELFARQSRAGWASWGDQTDPVRRSRGMTADTHLHAVAINPRRHERNTLRGFVDLRLPSGMIVKGCTVHVKGTPRVGGPAGAPVQRRQRHRDVGEHHRIC